ncbi:U3 small nucleolar RNA-associated protein 25 homolog [Halyomorpha halys]|uniref:U3 small nucleolar RNA-associated protein 25 homolog n=1 Tax=Halyomorpha halys TaxID=286706 RepID=UPI0006D4F8CE|nr:digestive organ expansion factor homolog [Halyomorpha halys]
MISSKYKRKKYNLLNLAEIPEKKKVKRKIAKADTQKQKVVTNQPESKEKEVEISPGDEFETSADENEENDPFLLHLKYEISPQLHSVLSEKSPKFTKDVFNWPSLGKLLYLKPEVNTNSEQSLSKIVLNEKQVFASVRKFPDVPQNSDLSNLHIKSQITYNIENTLKKTENGSLTPIQNELLTLISNYYNVYYPEVNQTNNDQVRLAYCIHAINHVIKTRLKILHHNAKLQSRLDVPEEFRDQGLVRPKVLILVPFKSMAYSVILSFISILLGDGGNIMNKKRFIEEYSGDTLIMPEKNPKPLDYQQLFSGNTDDNFKIGLTVTKKCLKLYADFYASDIIVASPLGLRVLIGTEGEGSRDYDFLASIEILIMDQAQVFTMQNWEHVLHVMEHMHLQPQRSHDTDLSRARTWALNGWARYYLQSLVFSANPLPEVTGLFNSKLNNYNGKIIITNPVIPGSISQVIVHAPQMFHYISSSNVTEAIDDRFQSFISNILPRLKESNQKHVLIYIPSYFDFVRLRNYFKKQELYFVQICEYTNEKKIVRARSKFFHGETQYLLYTERFHFFRRIQLRGIEHLIFYQLPSFPLFYSEMCNFLQDHKKDGKGNHEHKMSIDVLYTKFDVTQLAGVVGTERATRMLTSEKSVHMFMTDNAK